jgi:hypothetical protein
MSEVVLRIQPVDKSHTEALRRAARAMGLKARKVPYGPFLVTVGNAATAYRFGLRTMKSWRVTLGH